MPRRKKAEFSIAKMDLTEAKREFSRRRGRGSKYDAILEAAEALDKEEALLVDGVSYSEVTGIRSRVKEYLKSTFKIEATKVDKEKDLYDVLIHRTK